MRLALPLAAVLLPLAAGPLPARQPAPTPGWPAFVRTLEAYADRDGAVGASAALVVDGRIVARHHVGFADRATGRRVDERTIFHWASITKTLGAVAVMQLRDRGRLSLDDPIVRWVPELRRLHDPFGMLDSIPVRWLLSHSAGFRNGTWPYRGAEWQPFEPAEWSQLVAMMPYQRLEFRPGTRYGYSNPAYVYLARVVEQESRDPWATYVQKNIWAPLGMHRSYTGLTPYHLQADRGHGYEVRRAGGRDSLVDVGADFDPGITIPNGGWNAPVDDVAAWAAFLLGRPADAATRARHEGVLTRATLEEMWRPALASREGYTAGDAVGLGFFLLERNGRRVVGHTGDQAGYRSFLYLDPAAGTAVIAVLNTTNHARDDQAGWQRLVEAGVGALGGSGT